MIKNINYFENVVIGTSPLMLLVALNIAKKGTSVLVIDKNKSYGGCWQVHKNKKMHYECASHLIESYPGVYKILEEYSSIKFTPLKRDPIRVFKNGLNIPYENWLTIFLTCWKLFFGYILFSLNFIIFKVKREEKINYQVKLIDFLKYRIKNIFKKQVLLGPINGYASLLKGLINNCEKYDIKFLQGEVILINKNNNFWEIKLKDETYYFCKYLHCTSNINLKQISKNRFKYYKRFDKKRVSILVRIPLKNLLFKQSYVAIMGDKYITRIHRIDQPNKSERYLLYLVEIKNIDLKSSKILKRKLGQILEISKIIKHNVNFKILEIFSTNYAKNSDQLIVNDTNNFTSYYSNGNLAAGIHKWLVKSKQIKNFN